MSPPSESDMAATVRHLKEIADRITKPNEDLQRLISRSMHQQTMLGRALVSDQTMKTVQSLGERLSVQVKMTESHRETMEALAKIRPPENLVQDYEAFLLRVPMVLPDYSAVLRDFALNQKAAEAFRRLVAQAVPRVTFPVPPRITDLQPLLDSLRDAAERAAERLEAPPISDLVEAVHDAERSSIEADAEPTGEASREGNPVLVVAMLSVIFTFLANQEKILENAFVDAAWVSHALADVWEYALIVLYVLLIGLSRPSE